jgi:hypothetical protein
MMTKKTNLTLTLALIVAVLSFGLVAFTYVDIADGALSERYGPPNRPDQPNGQQGAGSVSPEGVPAANGSYGNFNGASVGVGTALTGELTPDEEAALIAAIEEEYGARSLYEGVVDQFDNAAPFSMIARSEGQHAAALIRLADKYGLEVPAYPGAAQTTFAALEDACQAGVTAEIADAALYDELLQVTDKSDLIRVFTRLQAASLQSHLPAFEACQ